MKITMKSPFIVVQSPFMIVQLIVASLGLQQSIKTARSVRIAKRSPWILTDLPNPNIYAIKAPKTNYLSTWGEVPAIYIHHYIIYVHITIVIGLISQLIVVITMFVLINNLKQHSKIGFKTSKLPNTFYFTYGSPRKWLCAQTWFGLGT